MIVKLENVCKTYKNGLKALNHLNYEVHEGEIYGLLGPNGSGKTTSINCILSLLNFEEGDIYLFDEKMTPSRYDIKKRIGLVPQNVAVFDELNVYENIDYFCSLYIKDKDERRRLVEEAINFVGLSDFKKFKPKKLSGGLLRRLNIACGIAHKPELIIFDEPTVAVDPQSRNKILEGIKELNRKGATIIYTSHYMEEIEELCNYVVVMDKGSVIAHGDKEKLKASMGIGAVIKIKIENEFDLTILDSITSIKKKYFDGNFLVIETMPGVSFIPEVLEVLKKNNIESGKISCEEPNLNDVFLKITGKELRD